MSSISLVVDATSKTNIQFYSITYVPQGAPSLSALARYSELRAFRKTLPVKRSGFPPKLYFPTVDDLDKRRLQLAKWLATLLPTYEKEVENFVKNQRTKYEEDELEGVQGGDVPLYVANSDSVRRYDPATHTWPHAITFHLFHVQLDMDSHLYTMGNLIWAPSFRGIQVYYPPWHKSLTLPYPDNFLKSVSPQHGVTLDYQFVLYHHKQLIALDIPTCAWMTFPALSPSVSTMRDNLWWPGFVAAGRHLHLIYPIEHFSFNTSNRTWKNCAPAPVTGTFYPAWVYAKKRIYMMVCSANTTIESYYYDVRLDEWHQIAAFPAMHNVPTVVNIAFDGNDTIYVRSSSHIFCYDIMDNSWEERKEMALTDRATAMFFSTQLESKENEGDGDKEGGKEEGKEEGKERRGREWDEEGFKKKAEKLFVKTKLMGHGPWMDLTGNLQITQVERDLMITFEMASLSERMNIFRKMDPAHNVFQQLLIEEPSAEVRDRIEWHIFQALQEDPTLGPTLCAICPNKFMLTEKGSYTWAPPATSPKYSRSPRTSSAKVVTRLFMDGDVAQGEEPATGSESSGSSSNSSSSERRMEMNEEVQKAKANGEKIIATLTEKNIHIPEEYLCPIMHTIMLDPVVTNDGHAFDKIAIEAWFSNGNISSPLTNETLTSTSTFPNLPLRKMIQAFLLWHSVDVG